MFQILTGDALQEIDKIKSNSIQCVYTSPTPPLNIQDKGHILSILRKCKRVLTNTGTIVLQLGDYYYENGSMMLIPEAMVMMLKADGWLVRNKLYWRRLEHYKQVDRKRFRVNVEYLYLLSQNLDHYFNDKLGLQDTSLIDASLENVKPGEFKSGYPEKIVDIPIRCLTRAGDTVLDPFAGTGTTGVVALKNKRHFIGIETNEDNKPLMEKRLKKFDQP